jgi:hypothetical protein
VPLSNTPASGRTADTDRQVAEYGSVTEEIMEEETLTLKFAQRWVRAPEFHHVATELRSKQIGNACQSSEPGWAERAVDMVWTGMGAR